MKNSITPVLVYLMISGCFLSSCSLIDDSKCGDDYSPRELASQPYQFTNNSNSFPGEVYTYLENGQRYFITNLYVENLCSQEHTEVRYEVELIGTHSLPLDIVGTTSWNFLYEEESVMSMDAIPPHTPVHATQDIGLSQAFGEDPGWLLLRLSLAFPTTNSINFAQDSAYFVNHVSRMDIYVNGASPKD